MGNIKLKEHILDVEEGDDRPPPIPFECLIASTPRKEDIVTSEDAIEESIEKPLSIVETQNHQNHQDDQDDQEELAVVKEEVKADSLSRLSQMIEQQRDILKSEFEEIDRHVKEITNEARESIKDSIERTRKDSLEQGDRNSEKVILALADSSGAVQEDIKGGFSQVDRRFDYLVNNFSHVSENSNNIKNSLSSIDKEFKGVTDSVHKFNKSQQEGFELEMEFIEKKFTVFSQRLEKQLVESASATFKVVDRVDEIVQEATKLKNLQSLDRLSETNIKRLLTKIESAFHVHRGWKNFLLKLMLSNVVDVAKIVAVATFLVFIGTYFYQDMLRSKIAPLVNLSGASGAGMALTILESSMEDKDFLNYQTRVKNRILEDINEFVNTPIVNSKGNSLQLQRLDKLMKYDFVSKQGVDLHKFAVGELDKELAKSLEHYKRTARYVLEKEEAPKEVLDHLVNINSLIDNEKYPEALEAMLNFNGQTLEYISLGFNFLIYKVYTNDKEVLKSILLRSK